MTKQIENETAKDLSMEKFLQKLASAAPAPGGGGAMALCGALSACLAEMVAHLTVGKKKYRETEEEMQALLQQAQALQAGFTAAIDADAAAFLPLAQAYRIPKEQPGRDAVLEEALRAAAAVPLRVLELCKETVTVLERMGTIGSVLSISDVADAAALARAAADGSFFNVRINTGLMKDKEKSAALNAEAARLLNDIRNPAERTLNIVDARITKPQTLLLIGKPVAENLNRETAEHTRRLINAGISPLLALIRTGERDDDISYERSILRAAEKMHILTRTEVLPAGATEEEITERITALNKDPRVHGILLFRPLQGFAGTPAPDEKRILAHLAPEKDVDGASPLSLAGVFSGSAIGYAPCTAEAVCTILKHYDIPISGKRVVVLGRSLVIGKPVSMLLLKENATVTICHSRTEETERLAREADILIVSTGKKNSVGAAYTNPRQVVIDVGIHYDEKSGKTIGDVNFQDIDGKVHACTPVPGGVGSVTTAILLSHVAGSAEKSIRPNTQAPPFFFAGAFTF